MSYIPTIAEFLTKVSESQILEETSVARLQSAVQTTEQPFDVIATELGFFEEQVLLKQLSDLLGLEKDTEPSLAEEAISALQLDMELFRKNLVLPSSPTTEGLELTVCNPFNEALFRALEFKLNRPVILKLAPRKVIEKIFEDHDAASDGFEIDIDALDSKSTDLSELDLERLNAIANDAPVVRKLQSLMREAVGLNASDIHIEPDADSYTIRFRIDGQLTRGESLPKKLARGLISRIKILADLNIAEQRLPQDGQTRIVVEGKEVDFRISILPSVQDEAVVVRLLNRSSVALSYDALGYAHRDVTKISELFNYSNGMVLVTGPTGSGKSTTMYTALSGLMGGNTKLITVEDPVEIELKGITQIQVNSEIGLTFPSVLRSILRHDPDVIMVGEIRDVETASIAVRSALTGHLVLATLHTNSAMSAVTRLRDLGIENYLIASTLRGVVSQRLVRKICKKCNPSSKRGCQACFSTGYSGRTTVYEYFANNQILAQMISDGSNEQDLIEQAKKTGMKSIYEFANEQIELGVTSKSEVLRVIGLET